MENSVTSQWQYQVRFDVNDSATAESVRRKLRDPTLAPLFDILAQHRAALKCQFDAFAEYVAAAEEHGVENYPLYHWTKATIENPASCGADIARQHQFERAADAIAIDRRDNRLGISVSLEQRMVDHVRDLRPRRQIAGDIGADREGACPRAGQHDGTTASVTLQCVP